MTIEEARRILTAHEGLMAYEALHQCLDPGRRNLALANLDEALEPLRQWVAREEHLAALTGKGEP